MNTAMLGLLAETSIHPGSGRSMGVVDLPVGPVRRPRTIRCWSDRA